MSRGKSLYAKERTLFIRVEPALKEHLAHVARTSGLTVSAWVRMQISHASKFKPPTTAV